MAYVHGLANWHTQTYASLTRHAGLGVERISPCSAPQFGKGHLPRGWQGFWGSEGLPHYAWPDKVVSATFPLARSTTSSSRLSRHSLLRPFGAPFVI